MFENIYNFFSNNVFFSRKRKREDVDDELPIKQVRYTPKVPHLVDMDKENAICDSSDDEVSLIQEVRKQDWMTPRESLRLKSRIYDSSTSQTSSSTKQGRIERERPDSLVPALSSARKNPFRKATHASKSVLEKACGPFSMKPPLRFQQVMRKLRPPCSQVLTERLEYQKLLLMYASPLDSFTFAPLQSSETLQCSRSKNDGFKIPVNRNREQCPSSPASKIISKADNEVEVVGEFIKSKPRPKPFNSLEEYLKSKCPPDVSEIINEHSVNVEDKRRQARLEEAKLSVLSPHNDSTSAATLEDQVRRYMRVTEPPVLEISEEEEEYVLPELTSEQELRVQKALIPNPPDEILANKFGLQITRKDMYTLKGLNWLNDEIINFYMNLLMQRCEAGELPKIYAFNTFFYAHMVKGEYARLKRWTRKVDLFSKDMIVAPVHMGMHWCMSVVDFRCKEVRYYDSMGADNDPCLTGFLKYLRDESMDKKKLPYDTSDWKKVNAAPIPQQDNGSDCGVFACMFAEHLTRDAPFSFSQDNMPYFRKKMVIEILEGQLIT